MDRLAELLERTPPERVGRAVATARAERGWSRRTLGRECGLGWSTLRAVEGGRRTLDATQLRSIAVALDLDVRTILAPHHVLKIDPERSVISVAGTSRPLPAEANERDILRTYLHLVRELRQRAPGEPLPLRDDDLAQLATALGGSPERIEASLVELIDVEAAEAAQLRSALEG